MYKVIQLLDADGNMKDVPMLANAATPFRFKQVFGQDLLVLFQTSVSNNGAYDLDFISELAFIMAKQAKAKDDGADLSKLNKEWMLDWLEQFDGFELLNNANEIIGVYLGNAEITSKEKKKVRKQSAN